MGIHVELRDSIGHVRTGLVDPSGGTFDAAGDFDRFIDQPPSRQVAGDLPILESIDPYGETRLLSAVVGRLMTECARAP